MANATLKVKISAKEKVATNITTFELIHLAGEKLPGFTAGSHIDVHVSNQIVRQYSLCNNPSETHRYLIGVLRDPNSRGGSIAMHDQLKVGDIVEISYPRNLFELAKESSNSILLAGGIGVTPILCMAEYLTNSNNEFEMHYCTRSKEQTAFLEKISNSNYSSKVNFHFDDGDNEQRINLSKVLANPSSGTHVYICGPKGFLDAALNAAKKMGWTSEQIHYEYFSATPIPTESNESFTVKLARSGKTVEVAANQTITQALAAAGMDIPTSCEQGICGTCLVKVIEGIPDHKDLFMTDEEHALNDQFTPCCSRSKTPQLVIDW